MIYLKSRGILSLGTVRRNRLQNVPFPSEKELLKSDRGTSVECTTKIQGTKISAVVWKDNRLVTLLSTYVGEQPKNEVKRFSKAQKKSVKIVCPNSVIVYNKHISGVDLLDANIGRYKIKMRTIKWYMCLFYHLLDVTIVNFWILYKKVFEQKKLECLFLNLEKI